MTEPQDPNRTIDVPSAPAEQEPHDPCRTADIPSASGDSLDAGLAAGFAAPRSSMGEMRPVLLREAEGESGHVVTPSSDAMPSPEETGERYQLQGEIARGGMGAVLRGRDVDLGRDLAVKVLLAKHAHRPEVAQRFVEEAQIGGQLQHPGVVPVYDIGRFGERPFFTMKLVKGHTLAALLAERADHTQDRPRFLGIALQVAQALAYAHAKGVIHRDLKPANVMVGAFGEVQVMDWGLAKVLGEGGVADEEGHRRERERPEDGTQIRTARSTGSAGTFGTQTEAGSLLGTPAYMPPEQANGDVALVDRRADVFGLGAILCEILTGKPPYVGRSSEEVRRKACNGDLADAMARLDGCGADAELLVLTKACLSPEAIDRPKDAEEVADGLSGYLNGVQERLQAAQRERAVALAREAEQRKRRKVQLALAGALLALLLGGGAFAWWRNAQAQAGRERDARNAEAVTALLGQAEEALKAGDAAKAQVALDAARKRSAEGGAEKEAERLGRVDTDLALLRDLDRVDQFRWTWSEHQFPGPTVVAARLREALSRFGLTPESAPAEEASARVSGLAVRDQLVTALDRWMWVEKLPWLRAVLRAIDPDPYRDAVRDAVLVNDLVKMAGLAGQAQAAEQPPRFVAFLGESLALPFERRRQLLIVAVQHRPGDLGLLMALGNSFPVNQKEDAENRLRWFQAAVGAAPGNSAAHNNLALALRDKGQVDEAIASYRKAIELDPKLANAYAGLGSALRDKGQVDEAIATCRKAIELGPQLAVAHNNLGYALSGKGQVDEAIACYKKALGIDPKLTAAHNNLGTALQDKGKVDEAIACYQRALELDPKLTAAHLNMGEALRRKGQVDEAIASCRTAIDLDPKYAAAHYNLGNALRDKGRLDEAIACFRTAIALGPNLANAHMNLGTALGRKGKVDEAIACFRTVIELRPKDAEAHYNLGRTLYDKGEVDAAIACFRTAIELDPKLANPHTVLGLALGRKGQVDEAIACFRKAIDLDPKDVHAHNNLGSALYGKGQVDEAIACYRKAIELGPKLAYAHVNLGIALRDKGEVDAAIASFRTALKLDPNLAGAHTDRGNALRAKGQWDEAIACFRTAVALNPKDAWAHTCLGMALADKGQVDEAIACLRKAIVLDPRLANAQGALGQALLFKGRYVEARDASARALELLPETHPLRAVVSRQVQTCERLAKLQGRLPRLLEGQDKPASAQECLDIARMCQRKRLNAAATRFAGAAFAAAPKLADDLEAAHRYSASCSAALAAAGQGEDAAKLDTERARLRQQALDWLRADLALRTRQLESGQSADRAAVQRALQHWQKDGDLAGIRDKAPLAKLPPEERAAFAKLWADVAALLKKAEAPPKKEGRR